MKHESFIRKCLAAFLLLVFSISIAPKAFFHDLIADHKDLSGCTQAHHHSVLHKQEMNCHFDDLVVNTPFTVAASEGFSAPLFHFNKEDHFYYNTSYQDLFLQKESRGPPSA